MNETEQLESGRWLFTQDCVFTAGAATVDAIPPGTYPEVAFVGRSNVGKSSLINALTGRKTLARVSATPGCTRQINFFALAERLMLVDLPGYGFAKVSKEEKKNWDTLITTYLRGRAPLRRVCLLVDSRRGILPADEEIMELFDETAVTFQIIYTKVDQCRGIEALENHAVKRIAKHLAAHPQPLFTSAQTGAGIPGLRAELAALAQSDKLRP